VNAIRTTSMASWATPSSGYIMYSCNEMQPLGVEIEKLFKARNPKIPFEFLKTKWGVFPDGTENSEFCDIQKVEGRHVLFLASFSTAAEKLRQLSAIYVLARRFAKTLTVLLPFSPAATMERIDAKSEGVIATADVDAHFFSSMPKVGGGPIKIIIYDLHTLHNRFYFHDSALAKMTSAVPLLKEALKAAGPDINIAFPDEGAHKRFGKFFEEFPDPVVCGKVRLEDDKREITITDGVCKGKHCVIIDDMARSGGTLITCRQALLAAGATKVSAFCTHAIFPDETWKKFTTNDYFEHFWITNTNPTMATLLADKKPFVVLDICPHFVTLL